MSSEPNDSEQIVAPAHIPPLPTPSTMLAESEPLARDFGPNTRILLICHAEGMHNRYRDLMANALTEESGLTAVGWKQADMLAAWLQKYETIDVLVSGGQLHSRLTSQRIGQALGLPVSVARDLPGLWGEDQELPQQDVEPDELDPEIHTSTHNVVARPYVEFHHALITTLIKIVQQNRNKTIAMVTSSGAIATIIRHFFGAHKLQVQV
ncbi:MAG: histidine phosphatase family protein, partial [Caldilineaceae bacterium]|nr:histidine phosphatase family protein [Caldilineaceae bacterium]